MHTESDIGIFGIIPREIHEIIVSYAPHHFWSLNKYFRALACYSLNTHDKHHMLLYATRTSTVDLIDYILQDKNIPFKDIILALHRRNICVDIVDKLLKYKNSQYTESIDVSVLSKPIKKGRVDILDRLLQDHRIDPSTNRNCAIQDASMYGNLMVVEKLLQDSRVDPADYYNLALKKAIQYCHLEVVDRLLQDDRVIKSNGISIAVNYSITFQLTVTRMLYQKGYMDPTMLNYAPIQSLYHICESRIHRHFAEYASTLLYEIIQDNRIDPEKPLIKNIKGFMIKNSIKGLVQNCERETKRRKTDQ